MNALEKVVDLLIACALMFCIPVIYYRGQKETFEAEMAKQSAREFLTTISTVGEISPAVWQQLCREVSQCEGFRVEIGGIRTVYVKRNGTLSKEKQVCGDDFFRRHIEGGESVMLLPNDWILLTLWDKDTPATLSAVIRSGGEEP